MKLESSTTFYKSKQDENTHVLSTTGVLDVTTTVNSISFPESSFPLTSGSGYERLWDKARREGSDDHCHYDVTAKEARKCRKVSKMASSSFIKATVWSELLHSLERQIV